MNDRMGREGFIKGLLSLCIIVVLVFVGFSFAKPYYRFNALRSHTKDILLMQIGNVERIRQLVLEDADELGVPLRPQNLSVSKTMKDVHVRASWSEVVDFWGYYQKTLHFNMKVDY